MKTVLITGGFGYLGSKISVDVARQPGWRVRLASRKRLPSPEWLPEAGSVVLDMLESGTWPEALKGVDAVVHLAAVNEIESASDPQKAERVNTDGSANFLEASIRAGVKRFIYFSTAHVYGAPLAGHITEQSVPYPAHPYASTHHKAEGFVLAAHRKGKIEGVVLRLSNGFGAPTHIGVDRWTLLVNDLCRQAVRNRKLVLRSSGLQKRDFVTLHDVGRVVCHFLNLPAAVCGDGIFNVGGDCSVSVWEMAQRIAKCCKEVLGFDPVIERPEPSPSEKVLDLQYDITKLKNTGFVLTGDIDEEIRQTLKMCLAASRT